MASPAHMPTEDENAFDSTGPTGPAPAPENSPGRKLAGRYRLVRLIERYPGVPAPEYWVGFDELLNREVGVYLVAEQHPRALEVAQAARESATVIDAHFIQILDVDIEQTQCYVVTEWVARAKDLGNLVAEAPEPLSIQSAHGIVRQLADAVSQAHACDITHGELKPSAVLVTAAGQIKILGLRLEAALRGSDVAQAGLGAAKQADVTAVARLWYVALTGHWPGETAYGLPGAPDSHGRMYSPALIRSAVPKAVDRLITEVLDPRGSAYEAKTLAAAIAALPRVREDEDVTRVVPPAARRAPDRPTMVQPAFDPAPANAGARAGARPGARTGPRPGPTVPVGRPAAQTAVSASPGLAIPPGRTPGAGGRGSLPGTNRSRGLIAAGVAAVVVIGTVAAFQLGGSGSSTHPQATGTDGTTGAHSSAAPPPVQQLSVTGDSVWDSDKGTDDADIAAKAYDPSSSTGWSTSTYLQATDLGTHRKGTGLIFNLGSAQTVGSVSFDAAGSGATAEVWTAPAGLAALPAVSNGAPPGFVHQETQTDVGGATVTFTFPKPVTTQYVLVWFTLLPHQAPDQSHPLDGYRDNIADVKFYS